jgi:hypothetical protein
MTRRLVTVTLLVLLSAPSTHAQFVVFDPANLAQAIVIAERTLNEYTTLVSQYETLVKMARSLGALDRYRIPVIGITGHDPARWIYGAPWLQGLNTGDARGTLYRQVIRPLEPPDTLLADLPDTARQAIQDAYATIEITDSIAETAGHQVALVRNYSNLIQTAVQALEGDVLAGDPAYHDLTVILDKVAAGSLLGRRQDMATNQLFSHTLEQLLAQSKRRRDTEAAAMNMRLLGLRDGQPAAAAVIAGAADDLRAWRLP